MSHAQQFVNREGKLWIHRNQPLSRKLTAAVNQIEAFKNQVRAFVNSNKLSAEEGDLLIGLADNLIDSLFV